MIWCAKRLGNERRIPTATTERTVDGVELNVEGSPADCSVGAVPNEEDPTLMTVRPNHRSPAVRLMLTQPGGLAEFALWFVGVSCVSAYLALTFQQQAAAQSQIQVLYAERRAAAPSASFADVLGRSVSSPDQSHWSAGRIHAFEQEGIAAKDTALAVIRVPSLSMEAPVFLGALDEELSRGPGWIRGTAPVGTEGNIAIAGHRDGFFRALKDIEVGDTIEMLGTDHQTEYRVTDIWIVDPDAVHVLDPTDHGAVTLVTCYPFYYVGSAPQRFIVRAIAQ